MLRNPSPTLKACAAFALLQASERIQVVVFFPDFVTPLSSGAMFSQCMYSSICSLLSQGVGTPYTMQALCRMLEHQERFVLQLPQQLPHYKRKYLLELFLEI